MYQPLTDRNFWEAIYAAHKPAGKANKPKKNLTCCQKNIAKTLKKFLPDEPLDYFEFGCGDSNWMPYLNSMYSYNITGMDYSYNGVDLLLERLKLGGIDAQIYSTDFTQLPRQLHNKFPVAASFNVLEYFEEPHELLKLFASVVKEDGLLITVVARLTGLPGVIRKRLLKPAFSGKCNVITLAQLKEAHIQAELDMLYASEEGPLGISCALLAVARKKKSQD